MIVDQNHRAATSHKLYSGHLETSDVFFYEASPDNDPQFQLLGTHLCYGESERVKLRFVIARLSQNPITESLPLEGVCR